MELTTNKAVTWVAEKMLDRDPQRAANWRNNDNILKATKYNLLVNGLNASTVLLTIAVVAAVAFFAVNAALVFGTIGLVARMVIEKELCHYTAGVVDRVGRVGLAGLLPPRDAIVINQLGTPALVFDEWVLWMNPVAVPV